MALMSRKVGSKELNVVWNAVNSTLAGMVAHVVQKAWDVLTKTGSLGWLLAAVEPYLRFNPAEILFHVLSQYSDGFLLLIKHKTLFKAESCMQDLIFWSPPIEARYQ